MQVLPARRRRPILARQVEAAADAVRGGNAGSNTEQGCNTRSLVGPQGIESLRAGAQAKHKILEECAPRKHAHEPGGADCLINGPTMRLTARAITLSLDECWSHRTDACSCRGLNLPSRRRLRTCLHAVPRECQ